MATSRKCKPTKIEGYKSTKTELIAIYRLEFYKNKKNWKLCQDVKKEPPSCSPPPIAKCKSPLNETYNIEPESDLEHVSPHNQAFLYEEPVTSPPDDSPDIQVLDPRLCVPPAPLARHAWVDQSWPADQSEALWQDAQQEWCGAEAEGAPADVAYGDQCDGPNPQNNNWATVNPISYEHLKAKCEPLEQQLDYLSPEELLQLAEDWLQSHGYPPCQKEYSPYYEQHESADESADFERGAHGVPHSSEIDLSVPHECGCVESRLCALSARRLGGAARAHARALRALLGERARRDLSSTGHNPPIQLEDYPTRDTDPPLQPDILLSGSHRPPDMLVAGCPRPPGAGRGRGRLHQSDRLIGIGMGRPYRL